MLEFSLEWITGMMLGIEFPDRTDYGRDVSFICVLDLLIVRAVLVFHRTPPIKPA